MLHLVETAEHVRISPETMGRLIDGYVVYIEFARRQYPVTFLYNNAKTGVMVAEADLLTLHITKEFGPLEDTYSIRSYLLEGENLELDTYKPPPSLFKRLIRSEGVANIVEAAAIVGAALIAIGFTYLVLRGAIYRSH